MKHHHKWTSPFRPQGASKVTSLIMFLQSQNDYLVELVSLQLDSGTFTVGYPVLFLSHILVHAWCEQLRYNL